MTDALHHHARRLLGQIVDLAAEGVFVVDRECRYVLFNAAMERWTGLSAANVQGKSAFDLFPYLVQNGEERLFRAALSGDRVSSRDRPFEFVGIKRKGYCDTDYSPWVDADGAILGCIGMVRDVTRAREVEQQVRETESRFKNMADVAPVLLWMSRPDGMCTFFNQTWLDFTGRTLEQEWGIGWAESVHFEDLQRCMDTYAAAFGRREVFEMEYRLRRHDGEFRWVLDRGAPRWWPDGTFAGYIGCCADITDRKHLEGQLLTALRARDELLSIASHELRTPITSLQLHLEMLDRRFTREPSLGQVAERAAHEASVALQKTRRLAEMVDVLLDVARIQEGRFLLDPQPISLSALCRDVVEHLTVRAIEAHAPIRLTADPNVDGTWDRFRLEQVLTNLLVNAIKYAAGKPIDVVLRSTPSGVHLEVRDHGPGLPREQHEAIFDRFVRFTPRQHYGGFGLGLWIAREIVRAHRGSIRVESVPGEGAAFIVELPRS